MANSEIYFPILSETTLLHFRTPPPIVIDDSSWKNAAESFTVALTLTLGGYESAIEPVLSARN